jgi:multidrug efflux pump subunit AcrB
MVIPVTLLITFIVLKFTGQSFNLMTLGGLAAAVGLVIDDAIVVLENIVLHRDAGQSRFQAIESALRELTVPLIGSTITPIVVFVPLVAITGVTGSFFRALAVTMTVALFTSLLLALTWTPTLSQYFVRRAVKSAPEGGADATGTEPTLSEGPDMARLLAAEEAHLSGFFGKIVEFYVRMMKALMKRPWVLAGSSVAIVALSVVCYHFLGISSSDGRRRFHLGLLHSPRQFSGRDQPHSAAYRGNPEVHAGSGKHVPPHRDAIGTCCRHRGQ